VKKANLNLIDKAIAFINPKGAVDRLVARQKLKNFQYDAVKYTRERKGPSSLSGAEDYRSNYDRVELMKRARDLAENVGLVRSILMKFAGHVAGAISYQARTQNPQINSDVEAYWAEWWDKCDISTRHTGSTLMQVAIMSMLRDGDFLFVLVRDSDGNLKIQGIESDRLGDPFKVYTSLELIGGIHIDRTTGAPTAYDIYNRSIGDFYTYQLTIPSSQAFHLFDPLRIDQYRGISAFHTAINDATDIHELTSFEKMAAKTASSQSAIVKRNNNNAADLSTLTNDEGFAGNAIKLEAIESGKISYLEPGEDIVFPNGPSRPSGAFMEFHKVLMRNICLGLGIPYSFAVDPSAMSGPTARLEMQQAGRTFRRYQNLLNDKVLRPIKNIVLADAVARGLISGTEGTKTTKGIFNFGANVSIDLGRESASAISEFKTGLRTAADIYAERGQDFESAMRQRAIEAKLIKDLAEQYQIDPQTISDVVPPAKHEPKMPMPLPAPTQDEGEEPEEGEDDEGGDEPTPDEPLEPFSENLEVKKKETDLEDCGTGAGGFKPGNTCAGGGEGREAKSQPINKQAQEWAQKQYGDEKKAENFAKWFRDSKVVDKGGNPLVVYHGTASDFDEFKPTTIGALGKGSYFAFDKKAAEEWAARYNGGRIIEANLYAKNPLIIDNTNEAPEKVFGRFEGKDDDETMQNIRKAGYDAVWAKNPVKSKFGTIYPEIMVFDSAQIKSTDNKGSFNPKSPNIKMGEIISSLKNKDLKLLIAGMMGGIELGKYDGIDFTPPEGAREAAKRALDVREGKPASQKGMTPVGIARARDLMNGVKLSPDTVRRMKAFFDRHEVDKKGSTWDEQGKGWQAWNGWGGDAGYAWARKVVGQMESREKELSQFARPGPKSAAQTPAPPKERIKGSKENPEGTASTRSKAGDIEISAENEEALKNKIAEFKDKHPTRKAPTLGALKKVFRRGAGAFSTSFRPTITGGKPNSRNAWAMARVNKFLKMAGGGEVKESYRKADGDLLEERFEDCGTGEGGFKEGNTCAAGGGGEISGESKKNRKTVGSAIWGSSKTNSFEMSGYSAKLMGVEGFKYKEEWNSPKALKSDTVKILDAINNDKIGSEESTFHGFQNTQNKQFKVGENIKLPLTATASDIESAEGYGIERLRQNQKGRPTIYEFPKGTKIAPYSVNKTKEDIESFGVYGEAITSGEFKIDNIKKRTIQKWYEDSQKYEPLEIDIITLKQSKTFNPQTSSWN
jgi:lambda family phage portal protein